MIRLIKVTAVDNSAARLVPPHFMKPFFARQARRPDQASSVAVMINIAKASNSNMVHPYGIKQKIEKDQPQSSAGAQTGDAHRDLKLEKYEAVSIPGLLRYSCNVTAVAMSEA